MIPFIICAIEDESDREFMTRLYIQYEKLMYSEIGKITRDFHWTEDIVQDTLVKLINKVTLLRTLTERKLVNYVISASKNTAFTYLKKKQKQDLLNIEEYINTCLSQSARDIEHQIILQENLKNLARIWPELDDRARYLLEARYILHMSSSEMAEDLGIKSDSVRVVLARARRQALHLMENTP